MEQDKYKEIEKELAMAQLEPAARVKLEMLEKRRITPDKVLAPMEFLFSMFTKPCFPRGELVAIAGKAKSGKTFVSSLLMALCFREELLTVKRLGQEPHNVLWLDTEQSEESTQDILTNRIMPMSGLAAFPQAAFNVFNVRADFWQDRLPLLDAAVRQYVPDLVVVDGVRDLVSDINDGIMAQTVVEHLMRLAAETRCCMVCILHQNKGVDDKNLRGWIGTELKHKAFEVYECSKDANRIFTWKQTDTRKYDILDDLHFSVGNDGLPRLCSWEEVRQSKREGTPWTMGDERTSRPEFNAEYVVERKGRSVTFNLKRLFGDALPMGTVKDETTLAKEVMDRANITSQGFFMKLLNMAVQQNIVVRSHGAGAQAQYAISNMLSF